MRSLTKILAIVAVLLAWSTSARADLVTDGDFSAGTIGTSIIPSWTATGNVDVFNAAAACCHSGDTGTGNFLLFGGGDGPNDGQVSQTLTTVAGTEYVLSFLYGATSSPAGLGTQSIAVAAGNLNTTVVSGVAQHDYSLVLDPFTFDFQASGPATTLTFSNASGLLTDSIDGILDSVSVVAVPEPTSLLVFAACLGGLGLMRKRRR